MKDYIAAGDAALLERNGLAGFDALWSLQLQAVDEPNVERGGWSSVFRLELEGTGFYLKRQSNHLTRTLSHPLGEPTFAREFRNILRYQRRGIPALQASFYGARRVGAERRAVLLTRALDGWNDLDSWLARWQTLAEAERLAITEAVGGLARQLHEAGRCTAASTPNTSSCARLPIGGRLASSIWKKTVRSCSVVAIASRISNRCSGVPTPGTRLRCGRY